MSTSSEIKQRASALAEKTDVNSITPKEVGGIMCDLASHSENVLRNGGTLGIRKVYESVAAMEADATEPVDLWGEPIKKGNLVVIYDGTDNGVDNNKIYAFMKPGWELATKLDAAYATKAETDAKLSELASFKVMGDIFSSRFIENIKKSPTDKSDAEYANGIFYIKNVDRYAGLNFFVEPNDVSVYYIINIKSDIYNTWDSTGENYILTGARKYNQDVNTPSGLIVSRETKTVESDGSLTLGVKIDNPDMLSDTTYRFLFFGGPDNVNVTAIKVYNQWEFERCLSGKFGFTAKTAILSKESEISFKGDKYEEIVYNAIIGSVSSLRNYTVNNRGENELHAVIENIAGYGNTYMTVTLPENYPYYIAAAIVGNGYDISDAPVLRLTGGDANNIKIHVDKTIAVKDRYVRVQIISAKQFNGNYVYPYKFYFYGRTDKVFDFNIYDMKSWAIDNISEDDFDNIIDSIIGYVNANKPLTSHELIVGKLMADGIKDLSSIVEQIKDKINVQSISGIVCWGSSSTAGGGWVSKLSELTGLKTYNGGVGGENLWTILGRIGSEPIRLSQSITIPSTTTPIQLGSGTGASSSILCVRGKKITPLLQGNGLLNPVIINGIEGTLTWTGSSHNDPTGYYTFTRSHEGKVTTTLPDEIVFSYGSRTMRNCIQILLLGYNGGYSTTEEYVSMVKRAKEFSFNGMCLIVGRHAAANKDDADNIIEEEKAFKEEFGMMFLSSREYMVAHGLEEAEITPTEQDLSDISNGIVPSSLRTDVSHFNNNGYTVLLNLIHRRLGELGYLVSK